MENAMFGAGCFWGVEAAFRALQGVTATQVGYSAGTTAAPSYEEVCTGSTGHAEVVLVTFDPTVISYEEVVRHFFTLHDPTTRNRQGPDIGSQYRSGIYFFTEAQQQVATRVVASLKASHAFRNPIVTEVISAGEFYRAEEYHQRYLEKRGLVSCHLPS